MGREIIWTPEALEFLEGILTYWEVRNGSKSYSLKLNQLIQACLKQVSEYPESGRASEHKNVYYRIARDYFIYYRFNDRRIEVVTICDMRRDPDYIKSLIK